jgi:hypothetical protein
MHEENDDREQYRQCAKANHCNSKTNVRHKNNPSRNQAGANGISPVTGRGRGSCGDDEI